MRSRTGRSFGLVGAVLVLVLVAGCVSSIRFYSLATFTSADGQFRVDVPGAVMTDSTFAGAGAFAGSTDHDLSRDADGMRFSVLYGDADPSYLASTTLDAALAGAEQATVDSTNGQQTSDLAITIEGNPAREQRIRGPYGFYRVHLVFVGNRLYSISVRGSEQDVAGAEANTFFNSFALVR